MRLALYCECGADEAEQEYAICVPNNASEVIREALRFMDTHEDWIHEVKLARLREQLKVGTDQLDRREGIAIGSKTALDSLFEDIKA